MTDPSKTFVGKNCKRNHGGERYSKNNRCVQCCAENGAKHYAANAEKVLARQKATKLKDPEKYKARVKKSRDKRKPKMKAYHVEYYQENKDRIDAKNYKWRADNPERARELSRKWRQKNRESCRQQERRRQSKPTAKIKRAVIMSKRRCAKGSHTVEQIQDMFEKQNGICACCDKSIRHEDGGFQVDHMLPISRGGSNWIKNIQLMTPFCNLSKGPKTMEEYMEWKSVIEDV